MSTRVVRWGSRAAVAVVLLLASATPSFAPHIAQLQITPNQAKPGQEVTVFGPRGYGRTNPVEVRFGSADGPVLGSFKPNDEPYALWGPGTVRIPDTVKPGSYLLYATQTLAPSESQIRGVPAKGEINVVGADGAPALREVPATPLRDQPSVGLVEKKPVGVGSILLVALGVGGVGLFIAGAAAAVAGRRRSSKSAVGR